MWRMITLICCMIVFLFPLHAQENEDIKSIARLLAEDPEDVSEDEVERLSALLKHPLSLNISTEDVLNSSGIFSRFQVASLLDYRNRSGPCMSFLELASLNGFGEDFVERIKPFVSLEVLPDLKGRASNEFTERLSWRYSPGTSRYGYTSRYKLKVGELLSASISCNRSLDGEGLAPDSFSAGVQTRLKKLPMSLVVGDFNARFGQGLALWSGSDFTSLNTPSAFMKRSLGVTVSSSYTGTNVLTGTALEYGYGRWSMTAFAAVPGIKTVKDKPEKLKFVPACNLCYGWKNGQAGITHYLEFAGLYADMYIPSMRTSCDFAICVKGVDVFSEMMFDWVVCRPSAVIGVVSPVGDGGSVAALLKAVEDEYFLALSGNMKRRKLSGSVSGNMSLYTVPKAETQDRSLQFKFHTQWQYLFSDSWQWTLRLTERFRTWGQVFRTDLRSDLVWKSERLSLTYRFNALHCNGLSWLTYLEGGLRYGKWNYYLKQGFFMVDDWDDRIYAYERDVPGAYNVPAFYGRGMWTSLMTSWKPSRWCSLYFRAGLTTYPFMQEKKPGKAELRFQSVFDF